jgi:hypothetical protein
MLRGKIANASPKTSPVHILPDLLVEPLAELVEAFAGFG